MLIAFYRVPSFEHSISLKITLYEIARFFRRFKVIEKKKNCGKLWKKFKKKLLYIIFTELLVLGN